MSDEGYTPELDTPAGLPGYQLDAHVPGATITFGAPRIAGAEVSGGAESTGLFDLFDGNPPSAAMDPGQVAALNTANTAMGSNAIAGMRSAVGQLNAQQQSQSGQPGQLDAPPTQSWRPVSRSGYLAAEVPGADSSLITALQSAASSAGPQAGLMAPTVTMMRL